MKQLYKLLPAAVAICAFAAPSLAYDWSFDAYITMIEPTYMPSHLIFRADNGAGGCPAGSLLAWYPNGADAAAKSANIQAIFSALLAAKASHTKVILHGNNVGCSIDYIHII